MLVSDARGDADDLFQDVDTLTKSWNKLATRSSTFAVVGHAWVRSAQNEPIYTGPARENVDWVFGVATVTRSEDEVAARVATLVAEWQQATAFSSSLSNLVFHPSFQRILALGPQAIPSILERLDDHPVPWFYALTILVDEAQNPTQGTNDADDAIRAWRAWGRARGLIR
jgi:hypothetical protein